MPELVSCRELDVVVDHRLFGLVDEEGQNGERPASPRSVGSFVSANATMLYIGSELDISNARLRLETWDGPAPAESSDWPSSEELSLDLPSGRFLVDEIAAGGQPDVFRLPRAGRWRARVGWRENTPGPDGGFAQPGAWALIQFWPDRS
ncbi:hypothetical protein ACIPSE_13495 [Streptomyces sp. NPDC090106]|uniref:hypothetical protein n=1 Tax=Streptomyces sp. NPDC090106 TaxID=3365946 RepID=UPI00382CF7D8